MRPHPLSLPILVTLAAVGCLDVPDPLPPFDPPPPSLDAAADGRVDVHLDGPPSLDAAPPSDEICNGLDDDGDGRVDESWPDDEAGCAVVVRRCVGGEIVELDDGYEPDEVTCDGRDNDCDGAIDEGFGVACTFCAGEGGPPCNGCPARVVVPPGFVCVPPGTYTRGTRNDRDVDLASSPPHPVTLTRALLVQTTEVTRGALAELGVEDPSYFTAVGDCRDGECPVERVSYFDAQWLAVQLSQRAGLPGCYPTDGCVGEPLTGCEGDGECESAYTCVDGEGEGRAGGLLDCAGLRLPTEAEWEYFARAGTITRYWSGDLADDLRRVAWIIANAGDQSRPVGAHAHIVEPNPWGLWNVHGNVAEWTTDGYAPYPDMPLTDPRVRRTPDAVVRGGHWGAGADACRSAARRAEDPELRSWQIGVRLVRTVTPLPAPSVPSTP